MTFDASPSTKDSGRVLSYVGGWLGIVAMLVLAPFFLASGLMAPAWGVVLVVAIWAVLFGLGIVAIVKRRPLFALFAPIVAAISWWLVMSLGGHFLGWTP